MAVRKITVVACFLVGISVFVIALYLCDAAFVKCKKNTLAEKWGDIAIDFILSLAFLSIPLLYYRRSGWRQANRNAKE
jgi:hypothetical protein